MKKGLLMPDFSSKKAIFAILLNLHFGFTGLFISLVLQKIHGRKFIARENKR